MPPKGHRGRPRRGTLRAFRTSVLWRAGRRGEQKRLPRSRGDALQGSPAGRRRRRYSVIVSVPQKKSRTSRPRARRSACPKQERCVCVAPGAVYGPQRRAEGFGLCVRKHADGARMCAVLWRMTRYTGFWMLGERRDWCLHVLSLFAAGAEKFCSKTSTRGHELEKLKEVSMVCDLTFDSHKMFGM